MHRTPLLLLLLSAPSALFVSSPVFAQTVFSPLPAYSSREGTLQGYRFGGWSKARAHR